MGERGIFLLNLFRSSLEPPVRQHLRNVYACSAMSTLAAIIGACLHLCTDFFQSGLISGAATLVSFGLLMATSDETNGVTALRMVCLFCFTAFIGIGTGPCLENVIRTDPTNIVTALIGTMVIFLSFTLSSIISQNRTWLRLGRLLNSMLPCLTFLGVTSYFFSWSFLFQLQLYIGLFTMCAFVPYDTQLIINKRRNGSRDFVGHSLDLLIDFIGIFRRLLIILTQKTPGVTAEMLIFNRMRTLAY